MAAQANPIWALDDSEVKNLAKAIQLFQKEFDVPVSDRAVAVAALGSAMWFVYGTRLSALYMDAQAKRNAARKPQPAQTGPLKFTPSQPAEPAQPADVVNPGEGFVNGAASFTASPQGVPPTTLVDPAELAMAINNPIPIKH